MDPLGIFYRDAAGTELAGGDAGVALPRGAPGGAGLPPDVAALWSTEGGLWSPIGCGSGAGAHAVWRCPPLEGLCTVLGAGRLYVLPPLAPRAQVSRGWAPRAPPSACDFYNAELRATIAGPPRLPRCAGISPSGRYIWFITPEEFGVITADGARLVYYGAHPEAENPAAERVPAGTPFPDEHSLRGDVPAAVFAGVRAGVPYLLFKCPAALLEPAEERGELYVVLEDPPRRIRAQCQRPGTPRPGRAPADPERVMLPAMVRTY